MTTMIFNADFPGHQSSMASQPPRKYNSNSFGRDAETIAAEWVEYRGGKVLARNYRCRFGEIDIIARMNNTLVFIEVKARKKALLFKAVDQISYSKQKKIITTATHYIADNGLDHYTCRFDAIILEGETWRWIANAFEI